MAEENEIVRRYETRLNTLLAELERETGSNVEGLELRSVDITTMRDSNQMLLTSAKITLKRQPGKKWEL